MTQTQAEVKADKKATKATEEMHRVVTSSLEEMEHPGAAAKAASHAEKTGAHKPAAPTKKASHKAESHKEKK